MYIHAVAFEVTEIGRDSPAPGQKWSYMVAIRSTPEPTDDLTYGPASDHSDYFTRSAAEQAAIHYGKRAIDIVRAVG